MQLPCSRFGLVWRHPHLPVTKAARRITLIATRKERGDTAPDAPAADPMREDRGARKDRRPSTGERL